MAGWTSAQDGRELASARRLFVEIESAARLPSAQQAEQLPRLYHDVCPQLREMYAPHTVFGLAVEAGSKEAKVRWQAAYSLAESRDPVLEPVVPSLVADPVADVRRQAGYIALSFDEAGYRRVQPSMMTLLSDADVRVRADVAVAMASRMDRVSAPVLLALVTQEDILEPWRQSNVVQAIQTLTGTYFGLSPGTPSAPPDRSQALKDFAQWIKEHPPVAR